LGVVAPAAAAAEPDVVFIRARLESPDIPTICLLIIVSLILGCVVLLVTIAVYDVDSSLWFWQRRGLPEPPPPPVKKCPVIELVTVVHKAEVEAEPLIRRSVSTEVHHAEVEAEPLIRSGDAPTLRGDEEPTEKLWKPVVIPVTGISPTPMKKKWGIRNHTPSPPFVVVPEVIVTVPEVIVTARCYKCNQTGHITSDCTKLSAADLQRMRDGSWRAGDTVMVDDDDDDYGAAGGQATQLRTGWKYPVSSFTSWQYPNVKEGESTADQEPTRHTARTWHHHD